MKSKRLRELSAGLIRDLELDSSATTEDVCFRLCQLMGERFGRDIRLRFDDLGHGGLSGFWAVTEDDVHVVIVTTARSWVHRLLILLHEIAHMLCGHTPHRLDAEVGSRLLFPDLSSKMLTIMAGRTDMSRREEREADQVAGVLARSLFEWARQRNVGAFLPEGDDLATRTWYALGFSPQRHDID
ncbi:MAG: hypothetical protein JOZ47_06000 [Kutzneria sp.]|nr:hypothetical protein [Kutzneria sp.]MBV9844605.1 hypothetical protein [Kutzneria sp.]